VAHFEDPDLLSNALTGPASTSLIVNSNDVSLIIDSDGIIRDVATGPGATALDVAKDWIGKPWLDTVTPESRPKIESLLKPGELDEARWRQVNHALPDAPDLPVIYKTVWLEDGEKILALGRELQQVSQLQQRLLDTQHSLERDYARLHQAEVRYRMLFSMSSEAILFVDADSRKIVEANPAAGDLLGSPANKLINRAFPRGFSDNSNDTIDELLLRVRAAGGAEDVVVTSADGNHAIRLSASLVRRDDGPYFLIRMRAAEKNVSDGISHRVIDIVNRAPDAFVVTDVDGQILAGNAAFLNLVSMATDLQTVNQPLDRWLGRPGIDVPLLLRNLKERGEIRQFETVVFPEFGDPIDVELSAVSALDSDNPCLGFVIRRKLQRKTDEASGANVLPRSLEEMTELVGRVPLKDLVRETTDIIERMCIEAALKMSNQSRASAAEMLGLSRQSLYVKLRRYGIGENDSD
jgi:transcriptional regulator PpsR